MSRLSPAEISRVVNRYVGVSKGYLGDFVYRTHADFYPDYCDLDINPNNYEGTTRERFIEILRTAEPAVQARILRGLLQKFPLSEGPSSRNQQLYDEILSIIARLEESASVSSPILKVTSVVVERAILDAETLLQTNGATSGVDRVHTALHGYLMAVCTNSGITFSGDATINALFKLLRAHHPAFRDLGHRSQDIIRVLQASATIMDALNPVRNMASVAHPNEELLDKSEALLIINVSRSLLHYLDSKLS
jgi:hypothetical protein